MSDAALADFLAAAQFWETPSRFGLTIESSREVSLAPVAADLDLATYKAKVNGVPGFGPLAGVLLNRQKMDAVWDLIVDPDSAELEPGSGGKPMSLLVIAAVRSVARPSRR